MAVGCGARSIARVQIEAPLHPWNQRARRSELNKYEKAFVEHIAQLNISGPSFAALAKDALEAEYGGEIDSVLKGLDLETLGNPEKFAAEVFKVFGTQAMKYYVTIIKYAESGNFHPEEDSELEEEEGELESLVHRMEPDSEQESGTDSQV